MQGVIVTLTSIRARAAALRETVESLVRQDHPSAFEVRVHLSHEPYLMDEGFPVAPDWAPSLQALNPLCSLRFVFVRNTGPYRKLLPVLAECIESDSDTLIVTCDDDTRYAPDWLSRLLHHHRCTGGVVAFRGHSMRLDPEGRALAPYALWQTNPDKGHFGLNNLPTGKDGVVYHPSCFDRSVLDVDTAMRLAPTADDLWFRWHTVARGVPCYLIDLGDRVFDDVPSFDEGVSLWEVYNKRGGNDNTIAALERHFQYSHGTTVAEQLAEYQRWMRAPSLPNLTDQQPSTAALAARQVRMFDTQARHPASEQAVTARSYALLRRLARGLPTARAAEPIHAVPRSDRGGMRYAIDRVDLFDAAYGWMARAALPDPAPLVTVVMTTFNAAKTVEWAARSVLQQDHHRLELIIVDDVSTDGTQDLLRALAQSDPRVRVLLLPKNRGTYFAKNVGLGQARGEYVAFQDSDDWSHPARLRLQLWRLLRTGKLATRCTYVRHHARSNQLVRVNGRVESPGFITLMARRDLFDRIGPFDCARRAADDELISRIEALHGRGAIDNFALPAYVALYGEQSLIADSSSYSVRDGLRFTLGQEREAYKQAYTAWHQQLQASPSLLAHYRFPPDRIFIDKAVGLRAFEESEIAGLQSELTQAAA
jgi:hypothetical protein